MGKRMPNIDAETLLCNYQGHTVFSVFAHNAQVLDRFEEQLTQLRKLADDEAALGKAG